MVADISNRLIWVAELAGVASHDRLPGQYARSSLPSAMHMRENSALTHGQIVVVRFWLFSRKHKSIGSLFGWPLLAIHIHRLPILAASDRARHRTTPRKARPTALGPPSPYDAPPQCVKSLTCQQTYLAR